MKCLDQIDALVKDLLTLRAQLVLDIAEERRRSEIIVSAGAPHIVLPEVEEVE